MPDFFKAEVNTTITCLHTGHCQLGYDLRKIGDRTIRVVVTAELEFLEGLKLELSEIMQLAIREFQASNRLR